jgi:predicted small lipoprotein YifL
VNIRASIRRIGWLAMLALPFLLAACGQGGTTGY